MLNEIGMGTYGSPLILDLSLISDSSRERNNCFPCGMCHFLKDRLCRECQTLIEHHDQIKLLSNARNNLNTTLKVLTLFQQSSLLPNPVQL